jgi:hypothetical protein
MGRAVAAAAMLCAATVWAPSASAGNDPTLVWQSLETKHFRVNFYSGEREVAERVADVAETMYETIGKELGSMPKGLTEISLFDQTESANGSATALPYNAINLYVTAPDDLSPLSDVDDWYVELVTHEFTHVVQLDSIRGIPAIVNALIGRTWAPNQIQPRWILEGLAVVEETEHTSGGRLRSSIWDMYMRADVLGNNVATIDQMGNFVRRWPQGNIWYLYGSYFMRWVVDTYGTEAIRKMIRDYAGQIVPWGFNRSIRRATGKTFEEMYPAWIASMKERYEAQAAAIKKEGIREGTRLTFQGQSAAFPRWIPKGSFKDHEGQLVYFRDDGHSRAGLYAVDVERDAGGAITKRSKKAELLIRANADTPASFTPEGDVIMASADGHQSIFSFFDLHRYPAGATSTSGHEGVRVRLTDGFRASDPAVSPDGRYVAFVSNHRGTRYAQIADLKETGITNVRPIVESERFEQAYTPRFSPDGTHVAYSAWTHGGYRDIRYVDLRTRTFVEIAHDRAVDGAPSFSADGKYIYFHSDRQGGVMNVFAWNIATQKVYQVTNVVSGAFYPEPSPDGKTLAYVGYTKDGFDLFAMPLDESRFVEAKPYVDTRPSMPQIRNHEKKLTAYNPLHTLTPRKYSTQITEGNFGQMAVLSVLGQDIAARHSVAATLYAEFERPTLQGSINYTYGRLPFDMSVGVFRSVVPTKDFKLGNATSPDLAQETIGVDTGIGFSKGRMFDSQSFSFGYSFTRIGTDVEYDGNKLDPYETPQAGTRGYAGFLRAGYSFSNAEGYLWSVGPERGFSASFDVNATHPAFASEYRGYAARANFSAYVPMPWLQHHSLALHAGGGTSGGGYPGRGLFYVGGFVDTAIIDTIRNSLIQGGLVLRGYAPVVVAGSNYTLVNAEYRFPILNLDHGPSTLPIFLNRITGNVFLDYGSAFDDLRGAEFKTGTGAEAWFDLILGYNLALTFRLGYARGLTSKGIDKPYFVAAVPY